MIDTVQHDAPHHAEPDEICRDFLYLAAGALGALGKAAAIWPSIDSMNPAADVLAKSSVEVDLEPIQLVQGVSYELVSGQIP